MTAIPETGREIPADELVERLRAVAGGQSSGDPWSYAMVADDLMEKAADLIEAQAARIASLEAERARTVEAERVISKLMSLIINVEWWVSNGYSETAREAIKAAQKDGWSKMGWRPYLEAKGRALSPLGPSDGANR